MVLVDTSIWIDHLRKPDHILVSFLDKGAVSTHPLVIEELACGSIKTRVEFLGLLEFLPSVAIATHDEVLALIESDQLYFRGLGATDVHLIASAKLTRTRIWSRDKALSREATRLGLS